MGTAYIGIILLLRVVQNFYTKKVSTVYPTTTGGRAKYLTLSMSISAVLALGLYLIMDRGKVDLTMILISLTSGLCLAGGTLCSALAMQSGTMVLCSIFSTAGLIIPSVCGIFFFHEPMSIFQWLGVAIFIGCTLLLANSSREIYTGFSLKTVLLLLGNFFSNGTVMLCQKLLTFLNPDSSVSLFSFLSFAIPALLCGLVCLFSRRRGQLEPLNTQLRLPILLLAVAVFLINQLATLATNEVSSVVLFAFINGGNTLIAAVIAALCYKERLTVKSITGIVLGLISLLMIKAL